MKPKALILCFTDQKKDPRPRKQIEYLKEYFDITTMGLKSAPNIGEKSFIKFESFPNPFLKRCKRFIFLKAGLWQEFYWKTSTLNAFNELSKTKWDLIIANEINSLPIGVKLKNHSKARLVFDAHEYYPCVNEENRVWRFLYQSYYNKILQACLPIVDLTFTVGEHLAEKYMTEYKIEKPLLCRNVTPYHDLVPTMNIGPIRLIHQGGALAARKLESLIDIMKHVSPKRAHLSFLLVSNNEEQESYLNFLKNRAKSVQAVKFLEPVCNTNLVGFCNQFDLCFHVYKTKSFNIQNCLPNKFFESLQARLGILCNSSSFQISKYIKEYQCGSILEDNTPELMAKQLENLTRQEIKSYKEQAHDLAKNFCTESEMLYFTEQILKLLNVNPINNLVK